MKITNGFKSSVFTAAALCFVMAASSASASPSGEAPKESNKIKKAGKVVELQMDTATNAVSATVALGTLNKPDFPKKGEKADAAPKDADKKAENAEARRQFEFITLSDEKVKVNLNGDVKVIMPRPRAPQQNWNRGGNGTKKALEQQKPGKGGLEKKERPSVVRNESGKNERAPGNKNEAVRHAEKKPARAPNGNALRIGELVQLIYSEDGKTVEAVVPLFPPMPRR